ncbi:BRCA2 and CDKN1A-interacting protein-like isoform X2 [Haliotis rubra]|uniref:BRCA2 and CDKN1A-interacting protein-like isoform X2 n=1 Tax=Haliotis rubra TaxID=36100 RepID=UPI001EE5D88D|nr:BRCA2 and CDKN1A-interacting protein-like isoform X2 [Haliotis rubra]
MPATLKGLPIDRKIKMASSKKKRVNESLAARDEDVEAGEDEVDDDDLESDEEDDEFIDQEVQVEFEARMPIDSDFHGIKTLLQQLFLKANINLSELTDTIIGQNYVGSVIKCDAPEEEDEEEDDDDPVFGIFTVVNLTDKKDRESIQQITGMLSEKCQTAGQVDMSKFSLLLNDPDSHLGLLISERFINIPPQIAVPSFESLKKDLQKAINKKMNFKFANFLMISKTYQMKVPGQKSGASDELLFSNSEEELIYEVCDSHFTYSVASERDSVVSGQWDEEDDMEALRTVMTFSADKLDLIIDRLKTELSNT